jgi:hypothetical protein
VVRNLECKNTAPVCNLLRKQGATVAVVAGNSYGTPGLPDRYVSAVAWHGWLEFKQWPNGKLSALQSSIVGDFNRRQPGSVAVVYVDERSRDVLARVYLWDAFGRAPDYAPEWFYLVDVPAARLLDTLAENFDRNKPAKGWQLSTKG